MIEIENMNLVLAWVLVLFYLVTSSMSKRWCSVIYYAVVFSILYLLRFDLTYNLILSFLVSILSSVFVAPSLLVSESFENQDDTADKLPDAPSPAAEVVVTETPAPVDEPVVEEESGNSFIDVGKTFLQAYKSLTPGQIETMSSDTKDLISTQKSLLETIKTLAPVVKEGKMMLDTFKDYFGDHKNVMDQLKGTASLLGNKEKK
jgi:hypothetical protein